MKGDAESGGIFRATFEDKIAMSDIVFCRVWVPVPVTKLAFLSDVLILNLFSIFHRLRSFTTLLLPYYPQVQSRQWLPGKG